MSELAYLPELHRLLPQAPDAEQGVLSSLLLAPPQVAAMLRERNFSAAHFHIPAHAEVYSVIMEMIDASQPVEAIILTQLLRDRNKLDAVGGFAFVSSLFTFLPTASNAKHYIEIVQKKHMLREVIRVCTEYAARSYDEQDEVEALVGGLHASVTSLTHRESTRPSIRDSVKSILEEIVSGKPDGTLLPTGMDGVDGRLNIYRGDLLLISAPTSCGKSALAFQIAFNVAMRGRRVALYPLEMRQKQSLKRMLAVMSGYNAEFVRKLAVSANGGSQFQAEAAEKAQKAFTVAAQTLLDLKLHIRDDLYRFEAITADIRAQSGKQRFDFIVIDYLQLIQVSEKFERRQLQIAAITQRLKALANEMDCVICVPSQVNRQGGTREAEDAENDASALIKIHAEQSDKGDIHPGRIEVWKQREGARHIDLPLVFNGLLTRFDCKQ